MKFRLTLLKRNEDGSESRTEVIGHDRKFSMDKVIELERLIEEILGIRAHISVASGTLEKEN